MEEIIIEQSSTSSFFLRWQALWCHIENCLYTLFLSDSFSSSDLELRFLESNNI